MLKNNIFYLLTIIICSVAIHGMNDHQDPDGEENNYTLADTIMQINHVLVEAGHTLPKIVDTRFYAWLRGDAIPLFLRSLMLSPNLITEINLMPTNPPALCTGFGKHFANLLKYSPPHLKRLSLQWTQLSTEDFEMIAEKVGQNNSLEVLKIAGDKSEFGIFALIESLAINKSIKELVLYNVGMNDLHLGALYIALTRNKTLQILDISGNSVATHDNPGISHDGFLLFERILKLNKGLKEIHSGYLLTANMNNYLLRNKEAHDKINTPRRPRSSAPDISLISPQ